MMAPQEGKKEHGVGGEVGEQNVKFRLEDCGSWEVGVFSTPG